MLRNKHTFKNKHKYTYTAEHSAKEILGNTGFQKKSMLCVNLAILLS